MPRRKSTPRPTDAQARQRSIACMMYVAAGFEVNMERALEYAIPHLTHKEASHMRNFMSQVRSEYIQLTAIMNRDIGTALDEISKRIRRINEEGSERRRHG